MDPASGGRIFSSEAYFIRTKKDNLQEIKRLLLLDKRQMALDVTVKNDKQFVNKMLRKFMDIVVDQHNGRRTFYLFIDKARENQ